MIIEEYQKAAMRTSPPDHDRILNGCLGLIGETGEIVDIVKKWLFQSGQDAIFPKEKLLEECGDVLWYCAELATGIERNLAEDYGLVKKHYEFMSVINRSAPMEITALRLTAVAARPALILYDHLNDEDDLFGPVAINTQVMSEVCGIISMIGDILQSHCNASLTDAMEYNIEKLLKRYPDGFDPERSLNRNR